MNVSGLDQGRPRAALAGKPPPLELLLTVDELVERVEPLEMVVVRAPPVGVVSMVVTGSERTLSVAAVTSTSTEELTPLDEPEPVADVFPPVMVWVSLDTEMPVAPEGPDPMAALGGKPRDGCLTSSATAMTPATVQVQ